MDVHIRKVTVAGSGLMGRQIALQCAVSGYQTVCYDISGDMLDSAEEFCKTWILKRIERGKLTEEEASEVSARLSFSTDIAEACDGCGILIEAVPDREDVKRAALRELDRYTPDGCIYASNSSYIVSSRFADAVKDPSKLLNVHFFNPVAAMSTVEVVKGPHVSEETFGTAVSFVESLGKTPVRVEKEIYGFVVNRIFSALTREACRLVDMGIASPEAIDTAVKGALGHPMGPLETLDMTGIDLEYSVYMEKYRNSGDENDLPAECLKELYEKGCYGRKTGRGFYDYTVRDGE